MLNDAVRNRELSVMPGAWLITGIANRHGHPQRHKGMGRKQELRFKICVMSNHQSPRLVISP
jgi:hypothetical protein